MKHPIPQEAIRHDIISDMVKKRNSIVPVIGEDTIVYKDEGTGAEIPFQEFILNEFQKKYPHVEVLDSDRVSMMERGYYGLSLLSQYYNEQGRFLDDFMAFVNKLFFMHQSEGQGTRLPRDVQRFHHHFRLLRYH